MLNTPPFSVILMSPGTISTAYFRSWSKGLSSPKRCDLCQRVMFFRSYRCKHCRYKCHKKCAKKMTKSKSYATTIPNLRGRLDSSGISSDEEQKRSMSEVNFNRVSTSSNISTDDGFSSRPESPAAASEIVDEVIEEEIGTKVISPFSNLVDRFFKWLNVKRKQKEEEEEEDDLPDTPGRTRNISTDGATSDLGTDTFCQHCQNCCDCHDPFVSSGEADIGEPDDLFLSKRCVCGARCSHSSSNRSSLSSNPPKSSVSSIASDDTIGPLDSDAIETFSRTSRLTLTSNFRLSDPRLQSSVKKFFTGKKPPYGKLKSTHSCPTKDTNLVLSPEESELPIYSTWPPNGAKVYECHDEDDLDNVFCDEQTILSNSAKSAAISERIGECTIPYCELEVGDSLRIGRKKQIYKGRWYGDVIIHKYRSDCEESVELFWEDVSKLSMIRHENIMLFMGACPEQPHLTIVLSVTRTDSLYTRIHVNRRERLSMHVKLNIARQIAQAMYYLHSKNIIMRKLNSMNIFLESNKVKLAILDSAMSEKTDHSFASAIIPSGHLTYVAPEILKSLVVKPPRLVTQTAYSCESDVFAFGTVLYELLSGCYPFRGKPAESIIWQIGSGKRQKLQHLRCTSTLKNLIEECWLHDHLARPEFGDISRELLQNAGMWKRHSSSEPEKINKIGLHYRGLF